MKHTTTTYTCDRCGEQTPLDHSVCPDDDTCYCEECAEELEAKAYDMEEDFGREVECETK